MFIFTTFQMESFARIINNGYCQLDLLQDIRDFNPNGDGLFIGIFGWGGGAQRPHY